MAPPTSSAWPSKLIRHYSYLLNKYIFLQAHEILALEILTLLLHKPTDDSVEVAVSSTVYPLEY